MAIWTLFHLLDALTASVGCPTCSTEVHVRLAVDPAGAFGSPPSPVYRHSGDCSISVERSSADHFGHIRCRRCCSSVRPPPGSLLLQLCARSDVSLGKQLRCACLSVRWSSLRSDVIVNVVLDGHSERRTDALRGVPPRRPLQISIDIGRCESDCERARARVICSTAAYRGRVDRSRFFSGVGARSVKLTAEANGCFPDHRGGHVDRNGEGRGGVTFIGEEGKNADASFGPERGPDPDAFLTLRTNTKKTLVGDCQYPQSRHLPQFLALGMQLWTEKKTKWAYRILLRQFEGVPVLLFVLPDTVIRLSRLFFLSRFHLLVCGLLYSGGRSYASNRCCYSSWNTSRIRRRVVLGQERSSSLLDALTANVGKFLRN
ncbi:hypothetical protein BIW11_04162 [Tropilaelaps mercedesae]|uniref:Secreted protein n=1 Tax=Tropilaelaps mercedesae TaxID=418985 RepID=A0A1V9XA46_9ACAR|nr:hypothetical protein BIW11_04162 [Tropilaelaps mercedesae]